MKSGRKLTNEDRILWGKIARSAKALPGRLEELMEFEMLPEEPASKAGGPLPNVASVDAKLGHAGQVMKPMQPDRKLHHPLEKPVKRKLARGHLALEARIDLHGLFQSDAHGILLDFLSRAHERGLRHVLVITGKGSSYGSDGALKRAVPLWFSKPEFRFLISSYEPAARQHGGDGALYVRLSRGPRVMTP